MKSHRPTALIADDEPLLREVLERLLTQAWPELEIVAQARNGREAVDKFEEYQPDVCFLDVHMPGMTGVEAARHIGRRAHLVFVTAYDQYAVQAFAQGVLDYLVKPVEPSRLEETVARLKERLRASQPASNTDALLHQLAASLQKGTTPSSLRWLRASHLGRRHRLPALRREVHDDRVARRRASASRGSGSHAAQGTTRAARRGAVRASTSLGGREHARDQSRHARRERDCRHSLEGQGRSAAGQSQLPALVQADVARASADTAGR